MDHQEVSKGDHQEANKGDHKEVSKEDHKEVRPEDSNTSELITSGISISINKLRYSINHE